MVTRGWYRHYKGHAYYVHGVGCAKHEEGRRLVVYTSVKTEESGEGFDFLARDEVDFERWVHPEDGTSRPDYDGDDEGAAEEGLVRRFQRITDPELSIVPAGPAGDRE